MPVDPLSTTSAIVQLLGAAKACLLFYDEARRNTPEGYRELKLRLEVEAVVYERWCSVVGLQTMLDEVAKNPRAWQTSRAYPNFLNTLQQTLRFDNALLANLIVQVLTDLEKKFSEARKRFQPSSPLESAPTAFESPSPSSTQTSLGSKKSKKSFLGRFSKSESKISPSASKRPSLVNTVKWLAWDKRIFHQLLNEVSSINESLLKLLEDDRQIQVKRRAQIQLLGAEDEDSGPGSEYPGQGTVAGASSFTYPDKDIQTLARVKRMNQVETQFKDSSDSATRPDTSSYSPSFRTENRLPQFQLDDFTRGTLNFGPLRAQSKLISSRSSVLIEWKHYTLKHPMILEQILRLGSLVALLNDNEIYRMFHVPHCKGLIHDQNNHRVGLVFDIPDPIGSSDDVTYDSLQSLIKKTRKEPPPLGDRFRTAKDLSVALHYLQSVHWLHKSFRSDNLLYFRQSKTTTGTSISALTNLDPPTLPAFFVFGLDLSRPDHPAEMSESISLSTAGFQTRRENMILYSHPDLFAKQDIPGTIPEDSARNSSERPRKVRFRAEFDIYSLGLVLLEIGTWRTLDSFQRQSIREGTQFRDDLCGRYCNELLDRMGVRYWRVTKRCLLNEFNLEEAGQDATEGLKRQFAFEKQVVCELEQCTA